MLLIFLLAAFLKNLICATALPDPISASPIQDAMDAGSSLPETRTVLSILYSCLATTLACTWVSVHPNVPFFGEGEWVILGRKIHLMIMALIAPELMIMWAIKQSAGARYIQDAIMEKYSISGQRWTPVHSHFLQMGGFKLQCTTREKIAYIPSLGYLSDSRLLPRRVNAESPFSFCSHAMASVVDDQLTAVPVDSGDGDNSAYDDEGASGQISPINGNVETHSPGQRSDGPYNHCECIWEGTLTASVFFKIIDDDIINFPTISKAEINDRSKSDLLNKAIASMQISWFVIQVIARSIQGLSISHLEITTTALAVINVTMYFFWLQKPFNVNYPVVILTHSVENLFAHQHHNSIPERTEDMDKGWLSQLLRVIQDVACGIFRLAVTAHGTSRNAHWRRCSYIISVGQHKAGHNGTTAKVPTNSTRADQMSFPFLSGNQATLMVPGDGGPSVTRDSDDLTDSMRSDSIRACAFGASDISYATPEMGEISQRSVFMEHANQGSEFLPLKWGCMTLALFQRLLYCGSLLVMQIAICVKLPALFLQSLVWLLGDTPLSAIIRPKILLDIDEDTFSTVRELPLWNVLEDAKLRMALFASILYSETSSYSGSVYVFGTIAGFVFAAIHISAIWLQFPSVFEKWLWATWSLLLSATCMSFVILGICIKLSIDVQRYIWILIQQNNRGWAGGPGAVLEDFDRCTLDVREGTRSQWQGMDVGERTALVFLFLTLTSYGLIRFGLLVMAFTLLRELPKSALVKISWSDLLPHI